MKTIVIIGAGAAGLMAAISAGEHRKDERIILLEKNRIPGKKILITGGGRCNLTSALPIEEFQKKIPGNGKFLYSAFSALSNRDLMQLLETTGVKLKVEGQKVYPAKDSAQHVINALLHLIAKEVELCYEERVEGIQLAQQSGTCRVCAVRTSRRKILAEHVIVATGGLSYPATGSDGTLFEILRELGVNIEPFFPSLVQMMTKRETTELRGVCVSNVCLLAKVAKTSYRTQGALLFTDRGISGPAVMDMSSYLTKFPADEVILSIDWLPDLSESELKEKILARGKKKIENKLANLLPHKLLRNLYQDVSEVDLDNLKKQRQDELVARLKSCPVELLAFGSIRESIVTKGGVSLKEVYSSTLEHKKIKGLFFAGECLDLDALTGGYNLQIAFSTGYLAGKSAVQL